ncbi:hypothetical protein [Hyalangium sp.]|uniref:hypothetical protein n=1 Tax=Hyalangium sp. TaxID=2028555 RepID=UPI002D3ABD29|nr:hypothetical protein [Hyalangium sp.]HYH97740.1 hypothetical protein [Hyalangium sp.]
MNVKLLGIYLNDHLAGSNAGYELARRAERENQGNAVGHYLATFVKELEQERAVLEQVMRSLEVSRNDLKQGLAWVMERLGRLKLNGYLASYSPLSRMMELEALCVAVKGKRCLWTLLERLARTEPRLAGFDFGALIARSQAQHQTLDLLRLQAADTAFVKATLPAGSSTPVETGAR